MTDAPPPLRFFVGTSRCPACGGVRFVVGRADGKLGTVLSRIYCAACGWGSGYFVKAETQDGQRTND